MEQVSLVSANNLQVPFCKNCSLICVDEYFMALFQAFQTDEHVESGPLLSTVICADDQRGNQCVSWLCHVYVHWELCQLHLPNAGDLHV